MNSLQLFRPPTKQLIWIVKTISLAAIVGYFCQPTFLPGQEKSPGKTLSAVEINKLVNKLVHEDFAVRVEAKQQLLNSAGTTVPTLVTALEDTKVRDAALEVLNLMGADAVPALAKALNAATGENQILIAVLMLRADPSLKSDVTIEPFRKLIMSMERLEKAERGSFHYKHDLIKVFQSIIGKQPSKQVVSVLLDVAENDMAGLGGFAAHYFSGMNFTNAIPALVKLKSVYESKGDSIDYGDSLDVKRALSHLRTLTGEAFEPSVVLVTNSWTTSMARAFRRPPHTATGNKALFVLGYYEDSIPDGCPSQIGNNIALKSAKEYLWLQNKEGARIGNIIDVDEQQSEDGRKCRLIILELQERPSELFLRYDSGRIIQLPLSGRGSFKAKESQAR